MKHLPFLSQIPNPQTALFPLHFHLSTHCITLPNSWENSRIGTYPSSFSGIWKICVFILWFVFFFFSFSLSICLCHVKGINIKNSGRNTNNPNPQPFFLFFFFCGLLPSGLYHVFSEVTQAISLSTFSLQLFWHHIQRLTSSLYSLYYFFNKKILQFKMILIFNINFFKLN